MQKIHTICKNMFFKNLFCEHINFFSEQFFSLTGSTAWMISLLYFYLSGYLIVHWWKSIPCVVVMVTRIPLRKMKICGVIVSEWILLMKTKVPFVELKKELSILSFISFSRYGSQKSKIFKNVLENVLRQQICLWNILVVLGYW